MGKTLSEIFHDIQEKDEVVRKERERQQQRRLFTITKNNESKI